LALALWLCAAEAAATPNDAMSTESLRYATVMPSSTTLRRGVGTAEAQNAQKGWEKWHATYDTLADNSPVVPNPSVWGYTRSMEGQTSDFHIPGGKEIDMGKEEPPSYRKEVGGVLVGYSGHVPRGRDKVGGASLGNVNDVHSYSPEDFKAKQLAQTFKQYGVDPPQYLSEARSQGATDAPLPKLWESGVKTGFGGHMPGAKYVVGSSVYNLEKATKGHFSTKGLAQQAGN